MNLTPPISWTDVATKGDVERLGTDLRAEFRSDLDQLRTEPRREIHAASSAHRVEMADLRTEFTRALEAQTRRTVGFGFALTVVALTAAHFVV